MRQVHLDPRFAQLGIRGGLDAYASSTSTATSADSPSIWSQTMVNNPYPTSQAGFVNMQSAQRQSATNSHRVESRLHPHLHPLPERSTVPLLGYPRPTGAIKEMRNMLIASQNGQFRPPPHYVDRPGEPVNFNPNPNMIA